MRRLGSRKVDPLEAAEVPMSPEAREHLRDLNLSCCEQIRRLMADQTGQPDLQLIVPEHGPPSAVFEATGYDPYSDPDAWDKKRWDRDSTGKFAKSRRR
jgi:hypothetical protein